MNEEKCFCHLNGYAVKDAQARKDLANHLLMIEGHGERISDVETKSANNASKLDSIVISNATRDARIQALEDATDDPGSDVNQEQIDALEDRITAVEDGKVDAVSGIVNRNKLYGTDNTGNATTYSVSSAATGNTIPMRDSNGGFYIGNGSITAPTSAVNKQYVDNAVANASGGGMYVHKMNIIYRMQDSTGSLYAEQGNITLVAFSKDSTPVTSKFASLKAFLADNPIYFIKDGTHATRDEYGYTYFVRDITPVANNNSVTITYMTGIVDSDPFRGTFNIYDGKTNDNNLTAYINISDTVTEF